MKSSTLSVIFVLAIACTLIVQAKKRDCSCGGLGSGTNPCTCDEIVVKAAKLQKPVYYTSPQAINEAAATRAIAERLVLPGATATGVPLSGFSNGFNANSVSSASSSYNVFNNGVTIPQSSTGGSTSSCGCGKKSGSLEVREQISGGGKIAPRFPPIGDLCYPLPTDPYTGKLIETTTKVTPAYPGKIKCYTCNPSSPYQVCIDLLTGQPTTPGAFTGSASSSTSSAFGSSSSGAYGSASSGALTGLNSEAYSQSSAGALGGLTSGAYSQSSAGAIGGLNSGAYSQASAQALSGLSSGAYAGSSAGALSGLTSGSYGGSSSGSLGSTSGTYGGSSSGSLGSTSGTYGGSSSGSLGLTSGSYGGLNSGTYGGLTSGSYSKASSAAYSGSSSGTLGGLSSGPWGSSYGSLGGLTSGAYSSSSSGSFGSNPGSYGTLTSGPFGRPYGGATSGAFSGTSSGLYGGLNSGSYSRASSAAFSGVNSGAFSQSTSSGDFDDDADVIEVEKTYPEVPADAVSLTLAYKNLHAPNILYRQGKKFVPEDKLAFGHRTVPSDVQKEKQIPDIPEEKLVTVDKPVVELKLTPPRTVVVGSYDQREEAKLAELEAIERESITQEETADQTGGFISYKDLGYAPVGTAYATASASSGIVSQDLEDRSEGPCGPLGPRVPGYVPGSVVVHQEIVEPETTGDVEEVERYYEDGESEEEIDAASSGFLTKLQKISRKQNGAPCPH